ncbi:MAG: YihY/virulence factor BrkB family protein [Acidimicrobiaceae bacterium]|nr:YihY/virulence factor BrkB family protein [Acidimicrobiaceae bacterium]
MTSLGSILSLGSGGTVLAALPSAVVSVGMFTLAFRIVTPKSVPIRNFVLGAAIAGFSWQILQTVGISLITHQARRASELYGTMGIVLGFLGFLYLTARISVYAGGIRRGAGHAPVATEPGQYSHRRRPASAGQSGRPGNTPQGPDHRGGVRFRVRRAHRQ